jgi:hypothetical protein
VVKNTTDRFAVNMISAVSARGALRFAVYDGTTIVEYITWFSERHPLHSMLGHRSPAEFEEDNKINKKPDRLTSPVRQRWGNPTSGDWSEGHGSGVEPGCATVRDFPACGARNGQAGMRLHPRRAVSAGSRKDPRDLQAWDHTKPAALVIFRI